jgi:formate hydrogenlyase transcriptional activator
MPSVDNESLLSTALRSRTDLLPALWQILKPVFDPQVLVVVVYAVRDGFAERFGASFNDELFITEEGKSIIDSFVPRSDTLGKKISTVTDIRFMDGINAPERLPFVYVPLQWSASSKGCLLILFRAGFQMLPEHLVFLEKAGRELSLTIENITAYENLSEAGKEKTLQLTIAQALLDLRTWREMCLVLSSEISKVIGHDGLIPYFIRNGGFYKNIGWTERQPNGGYLFLDDSMRSVWTTLDPNTRAELRREAAELHLVPSVNTGEQYQTLCKRYQSVRLFSENYGVRSSMYVPVKVDDDTVISLVFLDRRDDAYSAKDLNLVQTLAPQIGLAFRNMLSFQELREREAEKSFHAALTGAMMTASSLQEACIAMSNALRSFAPCDMFAFRFLRDGQQMFELIFAIKNTEGNFEAGRPIPEHVRSINDDILSILHEPAVYGEAAFQELAMAFPLYDHLYQQGFHSLLRLPLISSASEAIAINLFSRQPDAYSPAFLETLRKLVPSLSLAVDKFLAFEEIKQLKNQYEIEKTYLEAEIKQTFDFENIIGESQALQTVLQKVRQVSPFQTTVLITGETGSGKEAIARAVHNLSPRKNRALVKINCAALPANLIESELFGHEKGSFTGATDKRIGKFELASGGTIFLDEIGEMPLESQAKLLRVLQEQEIERVGGNVPIKVDVRVIAATNRNLEEEAARGKFRADLFYRLNVFPIHLPPLRERRSDVPMLAAYFIERFSKQMGKHIRRLSDASLSMLMNYDFPGNIRELEHLIEQAIILHDPTNTELMIQHQLLPKRAIPSRPTDDEPNTPSASLDTNTLSEEQEQMKQAILAALKLSGGKVSGAGGAAERLNLKPTTLEARMKKLGIKRQHTI